MKGQAEAFAVEAKGRAEAEQMIKKAEAFQQYKDGAMVDMLLEKLPLVRAASKMTRVFLGFFCIVLYDYVSRGFKMHSPISVHKILNLLKAFFLYRNANWHFTLSLSIPTFFS